MDGRDRKDRRHHHDKRRHRVEENEQVRGRDHKRRPREENGPSRHDRRKYDEWPARQQRPFAVLKSLQAASGGQGHGRHVQQWLGEIDGENVTRRAEYRPSSPGGNALLLLRPELLSTMADGKLLDHRNRHKHSAIAVLEALHKTTPREKSHPRPTKHSSRPRKRHTSTDSSMVQPVHISTGRREQTESALEAVDNMRPPIAQDTMRKRKYVSDDDLCPSSELPEANEMFEKRRRHKTKEDRYDAKAKKSKAAAGGNATKKKTKKVKRGDAAKVSRAAGEDLIRAFASDKIAQQRLTMRPGTGIFSNGKASSPSGKRGITDLAFSEMDFLSHSKKEPAAAADKEIVTSKHGQKMHRERERTRNEISKYFAPRQPVPDVQTDRQNWRNFSMHSERGTTTLASSEFGGTSYLKSRSPRQQPLGVKEQYLGFGTNISSPRKFSLPPPPQEPIYMRPNVETERSATSSSASYVSWFETAKSTSRRGSPARGLAEKAPPSISSSPSVLRRRLIDSGILDGLGLHSNHRSMHQASTRIETPSREDLSSQHSSHVRHSRVETDSGDPCSPFYQQVRDPQQNLLHDPFQSRRQQIEAARRAISQPAPAAHRHRHDVDSTRDTLASKAYLRQPPSRVPRRPATATPVRQSCQNRVLSRSSLQHEVLQDSEPTDVSVQPSSDFSHYGMNKGGAEREDCDEHYLNVPSHVRIPVYGDNRHGQQLWAQEPMDRIAHEKMAKLEYDDTIEAERNYNSQDDGQYEYDLDFLDEQAERVELPFEQAHYQENTYQEDQFEQEVEQVQHTENTHQGEKRMADSDTDYHQTPHEPDPMNQYFQTPRGQSYFQQTRFERPILQDDAHRPGLLEEDQLRGFWTTRRW